MAERSGNVQGMFNIGFMYETGDGVTVDQAKAMQYFKRAAVEGDARAAEKVSDYRLFQQQYEQRLEQERQQQLQQQQEKQMEQQQKRQKTTQQTQRDDMGVG